MPPSDDSPPTPPPKNVTDPAVEAYERVLTDQRAERVELFAARVERWWPDLVAGLAAVYAEPEAVAERVVALAAQAFADRSPELHALDLKRSLAPDWFQRPEALGYAAYADRFADGLDGVGKRAPYLRDLGVNYLHLMPLLEARPGPNDGGYAVADYRAVEPHLGTIDDLRELTATLRGNGISLCLDLVLNHVAREHEWAVAARGGDEKYRAYFHWYADRELPDVYEMSLPEVFPDFAPGNFSYDDELGAWVWTTFNRYQWDLNWSNPDVFCEYADIILYLANLGVEVLRLDAIAFIWKRLGTNCQNQPEVHAITQALRAITRIACPATIFKAEAIVGAHDLVTYLGAGEHWGKVSDLAYHNHLMVHAWSMLASRDVRLASHALSRLSAVPSTTAWITYARCHDDIGWAIDDTIAAEIGLSGHSHRSFLSDFYSNHYPMSFARGLTFQYNEATGDRRISGSLASLAGLESAIDSHNPVAIELAVGRIRLVHAIVLGWGGLPVLWMGDEFGLLNDSDWATDPSHADDNRWVHRPQMPWDAIDKLLGGADPDGPPSRVFDAVRELIVARAALPHLHASVAPRVLAPDNPGIFAVAREHPVGAMLGLYNVSDDWRAVPTWRFEEVGLDPYRSVDNITGSPIEVGSDGRVWLAPYAAVWATALA